MSTNDQPTEVDRADAPGAADDVDVIKNTGFVVVRLRDERENDAYDDLVSLAEARKLTDITRVLDEFGITSVPRLVTVASPGQLREMEQAGADRPFHRAESLTQYWRIDTREPVGAQALPGRRSTGVVDPKLVEALRALSYVESAYAEPRMVAPEVTDTETVEPRRTGRAKPAEAEALAADAVYSQDFLTKAPKGIDALYAWSQPGGDGNCIGIVDLEQGWQFDHVELKHVTIEPLLTGDVRANSRGHGTAVLGVLIANHGDNKGVRGLVKNPRSVNVASHYRAADDSELHVANAVVAANLIMKQGDVLLVEVQTPDLEPIEVDPAAATAISKVCESGKIAVIAAGNGDWQLDTMPNLDGALPFSPEADPGHDTGAIFVGAARADVVEAQVDQDVVAGHERHLDSNHGSRVDCHAWGTLVATSGWEDGTSLVGVLLEEAFVTTFARTSAASAIVAGAAVLIQAIQKAVHGTLLEPVDLRAMLRDEALCTPQVNEQGKKIRGMPNLRLIADRIAPPVPPVAPGP